jgi:integrase/recombinase XerD
MEYRTMTAPVVTIFVRHRPSCKWAGEDFHKGCSCSKHFRWSQNGKQYRRSAGTRVWAEAEREKRNLEDQLAGRAPVPETTHAPTIADAVTTFLDSRRIKGVADNTVYKYELELKRFVDFCELRKVYTFVGITLPLIVKYQATLPQLYPSTYTQHYVGLRLRVFLLWCRSAGYVDKVPRMDLAKIDEPPTMPLTDAEYKKLLSVLDHCDCGDVLHNPLSGFGSYPGAIRFTNVKNRVRAIIQLMRWSGLAVSDASTLKRSQLTSNGKNWRVITSRQKTDSHVYVPIPERVAREIMEAACGDEAHLFWDHTRCTATSFAAKNSQAISSVFRHAGITSEGHMVSHRLRDTFAVWKRRAFSLSLSALACCSFFSSVRSSKTSNAFGPW